MKSMNYSIIRTIVAIIIGLVLVIWPDAASDYIVITLGVLFMIPGLISIISFFTSGSGGGSARSFPLAGIGSLLFGLWLIIMPAFFANVLMYVLGFILVLGGVQQISSLVRARKWMNVPVWSFIVPVLIFVAGIVVVFNPVGVRNTAFIIIGVTSLVYGAVELFNWFMFLRRRPSFQPNGPARSSSTTTTSVTEIEDAEIIDD